MKMFQSLVISISQLMLKPTQYSTISLITFLGHKIKYIPEKFGENPNNSNEMAASL
jgi:hypothetical protein